MIWKRAQQALLQSEDRLCSGMPTTAMAHLELLQAGGALPRQHELAREAAHHGGPLWLWLRWQALQRCQQAQVCRGACEMKKRNVTRMKNLCKN